ncbi:MAG: RNA polymerase sigma factor [Rhodothermales bacterium]|nr:RNA polymerase sigma factor [Rhodothermales bacterium]
MPPSNAFDTNLVEQARQGNAKALERLLHHLEPILRGFFIKRIGPRTEIDDLVQNTLLRVHHGLKDLKEAGSLKAFAMKAALFELQDLYRGRYRTKENLFDPDESPRDSGAPPQEGAGIDLERALASLSPRARQIIELKAYGYRYEEIATIVDTTEAAIKMQVKRAMEKMREALMALTGLVLMLPSKY